MEKEQIVIREGGDFSRMVPLMLRAGLEIRPDAELPDNTLGRWEALTGGQTAGFVLLEGRDADTAVLRYVAVEPLWQGQGLGTRLVRRAEECARQAGAKRVVLTARVPGFYQKLGYHTVNRGDAAIPGDCAHCPQFHRGCEAEMMERKL
jgi:amino-acid N-acetyltransferase